MSLTYFSEIKNGGLDQYGAEPSKKQQSGTAGVGKSGKITHFRVSENFCPFKDQNSICCLHACRLISNPNYEIPRTVLRRPRPLLLSVRAVTSLGDDVVESCTYDVWRSTARQMFSLSLLTSYFGPTSRRITANQVRAEIRSV